MPWDAPGSSPKADGACCVNEILGNAVLLFQKESWFRRQRRGQFLPGNHAQPASQLRARDCGKYLETVFDQVGTAPVANDTKAAVVPVSGQRATNQLTGAKPIILHGQAAHVEDLLQIPIAMNQIAPGALKIPFRELRFDE